MHKDKNGKTQDHRNGCPRLGKRGTFECVCLLRLSYKTVDSYHIGKLRAIFHAIGRDGEWVRRLGPGGEGVLDISLGEEVRRGPSYPDPV